MNVTSASSSSISRLPLTVQSSAQRITHQRLDEISGVYQQREERQPQSPNLDPALDRKLANIGKVQFAFGLAIKAASQLESHFLFDPIV